RARHRHHDPPEPLLGVHLQRRADPRRRGRALSTHRLAALTGARRGGDGALVRDRRDELATPAVRTFEMRPLVVAVLVAVACGPAARAERTPTTPQPAATNSPATTVAPPAPGTSRAPLEFAMKEYPLPRGQGPHDVAPAADGGVWYTAQLSGELGWLDPKTGQVKAINLGAGSAPHGVIVGPDGAPWITDGGLNAIVRVDPATSEVKRFALPADRSNANLNTAVFDRDGRTLWFTGQSGVFGRLDTQGGAMTVFDAPRGAGPYGIATCPDGEVYFASLAGSYVGRIQKETGGAVVLAPPTANQGARRVWCDSKSRVWVAEWNAGQLAVYEPATQ